MYSSTLRKFYRDQYKTDVGLYSYGGCFNPSFNLGGTVKIGRYCSIAQGVRYYGANHPIEKVAMSAIFYNKAFGFPVHDVQRGLLEIGNDVWIGGNVLITCGCKKIGNGAVIGAGAVVTKDVPAYSIVVGVPAKVINYRFSDEVKQKIDNSGWFNQNPQWLMSYYNLMSEPVRFADRVLSEIDKN